VAKERAIEVKRATASRVAYWPAAVLLSLAVLGAVGLGFLSGALTIGLLFLTLCGLSFGAIAALIPPPSSLGEGSLRVDDDGVHFDGALLVRTADIRRADVVPKDDGTAFLRIERSLRAGGLVQLGLSSADEARRMLARLGQGPDRHAASFSVTAASTGWFLVRALILSLCVVSAIAGGWVVGVVERGAPIAIAGVLALFVAALTIVMRLPSTVTVGADGVLIRGPRTRVFHPLSEIERAEVVEASSTSSVLVPIFVRLHLTQGRTRDVVAAQWGGFTDRIDARARAKAEASRLAERVNEAIAARAGESRATRARALARDSRPIATWIAALRAATARTQTFREEGLSVDELFEVVEDARATHEQRAAAAIALGPHLDDAGRARVRVAAETTAVPKLRVALEASLEEDDRALGEAFEALENDEHL
jgi:hypothetical protein